MDYVSLGWLRSDGGRDFKKGVGRLPPERKPTKEGNRSIFLADYDGPIERADTVRLHPARAGSQHLSLLDDLRRHDIAIGYTTTALVKAALEGLRVVCKDNRNIMAETNWYELLPYADWRYDEIENGDLWEHLLLSRPQLTSRLL